MEQTGQAEIHYLHGAPSEIPLFWRVGHTGYRRLEDLHAAQRFSIGHAVVDAAHLKKQQDLLRSLKNAGVEIALDTNVAELSARGRYTGAARELPWASELGRPIGAADFSNERIKTTAEKIADFAMAHEIDTVLSPTHLIESANSVWLDLDSRLCEALRLSLDRIGGQKIRIDYLLLLSYRDLRDAAARAKIVTQLQDLPFENLWLRTAGFGDDGTASGLKEYVGAAHDFHALNKPIIGDHVGGLMGLGLTAFGAVGGLSHGISTKERFDTSSWIKAPKEKPKIAMTRRVYFEGLDTHLPVNDAEILLAARGAKPILGCQDHTCCEAGIQSLLRDTEKHFMIQRSRQIEGLNRVPDLRRPSHFVEKYISPAAQSSRSATKLKLENESLKKKLVEKADRLERMRSTSEHLVETGSNLTRSKAPTLGGAKDSLDNSGTGKEDG